MTNPVYLRNGAAHQFKLKKPVIFGCCSYKFFNVQYKTPENETPYYVVYFYGDIGHPSEYTFRTDDFERFVSSILNDFRDTTYLSSTESVRNQRKQYSDENGVVVSL